MPIQITLEDDKALVLFELLASRCIEAPSAPERNALSVLQSLLEKHLAAPFSANYAELLASARSSLVTRYGA